MAVLMNKQLGFIVEGGYRASVDVKPGQFVTVDYATKEVAIATSIEGARLVLQRNDTIDEQGVADSDVVYKKGELVPLYTLQVGDVFTTDQFAGDITAINVGDELTVGAGGVVGSGVNGTLAVKDKGTLFGNPAIKLEVLSI